MTSGVIDAALQEGVYTRLTADATLTAALADGAASVTAAANPPARLPCVVIAGTACRPAGTQDYDGCESDVTLDIYSRKPGGAEARSLAARVAFVLTEAIDIPGQVVQLCRVIETTTQTLNDGETYRARVVIRVLSDAGVTP